MLVVVEILGGHPPMAARSSSDAPLAILSRGERIVYEPRAMSFTKACDSVFKLLNQRCRWLRGAMQVLRKFWQRLIEGRQSVSPRLCFWLIVNFALD
jgi:cellulose synthase/poly-beta-1,6-N-acetylglucosamine synthase-like glycosyltransferase